MSEPCLWVAEARRLATGLRRFQLVLMHAHPLQQTAGVEELALRDGVVAVLVPLRPNARGERRMEQLGIDRQHGFQRVDHCAFLDLSRASHVQELEPQSRIHRDVWHWHHLRRLGSADRALELRDIVALLLHVLLARAIETKKVPADDMGVPLPATGGREAYESGRGGSPEVLHADGAFCCGVLHKHHRPLPMIHPAAQLCEQRGGQVAEAVVTVVGLLQR
mmetsp:Transcript_82516/g.238393  ORF Transcript_82516/g.238393 Transcript_82516/m.238393 type:complete len:221 (-) Transcript_82516:1529-2191(-)